MCSLLLVCALYTQSSTSSLKRSVEVLGKLVSGEELAVAIAVKPPSVVQETLACWRERFGETSLLRESKVSSVPRNT